MMVDFMVYGNLLERAIAVAVDGHAGQVDKQDAPYILHCLRVMLAGQNEEEQIVGVLHDLLEDTTFTYRDLAGFEFPDPVILAVIALTKGARQPLYEYYDQVAANPLALRVKRYDIHDNYTRLHTLKDVMIRQRLEAKYLRARQVLFGQESGSIYFY